MNKALRAVVVILLLLAIGALTLGILLFQKREEIKGRTQRLEKTVIQLGTLIEAETPAAPARPDYPAKDISECTAEILDTPQLSDFWTRYKPELEVRDTPTLNLNTRQTELMTFYKIDLITGKVARDAQGYPVTTGEGTMQGVLDGLVGKATDQLNRLNETRLQLASVRKELADTIVQLNDLKRQHRTKLKEIVDLNAEIDRLKSRIADLEREVAALKEEKARLEQTIAEQRKEIETLQQEKDEQARKIDELKDEIKGLRDITPGKPPTGTQQPGKPAGTIGAIEPGQKGKVVAVNPRWNFVVVELTPKFIAELFKDPAVDAVPEFELMLKRPGTPEKFVTKVRIVQINKAERLGVANILNDWLQMPIEAGDVLFYQ